MKHQTRLAVPNTAAELEVLAVECWREDELERAGYIAEWCCDSHYETETSLEIATMLVNVINHGGKAWKG